MVQRITVKLVNTVAKQAKIHTQTDRRILPILDRNNFNMARVYQKKEGFTRMTRQESFDRKGAIDKGIGTR